MSELRMRACAVCGREIPGVEGAVYGWDGTEFLLCHPATSTGPTCYSMNVSHLSALVAARPSEVSGKEAQR